MSRGVARNLIWGDIRDGVYVLTSRCNFKTYVNVLHVIKTVTELGWGIYTPVATPLAMSIRLDIVSALVRRTDRQICHNNIAFCIHCML